uniref:Uncharacterized protein n=1 Tax=Chenopodium quinoa TaxID=63459 RepID=A0A803LAT4_CHEQI
MKQGQHAMGVPISAPPNQSFVAGEFSSGLCDCFSDCSLSCGVSGALYSLLLAFTGCQWIYSCAYRSKLKAQLGMPENSCGDCCTHFWCEACALCQEYRELQHRGYDLALGWQGNVERQNQGMVPPSMAGGMTR